MPTKQEISALIRLSKNFVFLNADPATPNASFLNTLRVGD